MPTVIPHGETSVDTRDGNHFEIYTVYHKTGTVTDIAVGDSCVSAAILPDDITAAVPAAQETSESAGITVQNRTSGASGLSANAQVWIANDGIKQITIASGVVTGTYYVVARFIGSAAGHGGGAKTLNY